METNMDLLGTFSMVVPPIPWKLEIMVEPNMARGAHQNGGTAKVKNTGQP